MIDTVGESVRSQQLLLTLFCRKTANGDTRVFASGSSISQAIIRTRLSEVPIRNRNTRQAYFHATSTFLFWCEQRGLEPETIEPIHVAVYIETHPGSAPTQKQHMAAIYVLFSCMVKKASLP